MYRFFVFFLAFCNVFALFAQKQGKKIAFRAEWQFHDENYLPGVDRLIGNVVFTHENTVGYADSAYFYSEENRMVAFGKPVEIFVNDTIELYGRKAVYDGNTKISNISENVILKDPSAILYTEMLIYNTHTGEGYYNTGGKMISNEDTLTSKKGIYNTNTNLAQFRHEVVLRNPSYVMTCDSFNYDTNTEIVYFLCRTHLVSDENNIWTNSGWYDTRNNFSHLYDSVKFVNKNQVVTADSAYYDKNLEFGIVKNNITLVDTTRNFIVKGHYGEYLESGGWTWITDSALFVLIDKERNDTLYLHGDTLKMYFDTVQNPELMLAYYHVKFIHPDIQGACDSMSYNVIDSVGMMFYNPVLWNKKNQLTGDTIRFTVIDSVTQQLELLLNAFIVSDVFDEMEFDQVKGKIIVGLIQNRELKQITVINNVELIYYVMDEDTLLIGINRMEANVVKIFLQNNDIQELRFYDNPDGKFWADNELPMTERRLRDFRWLDAYRPKEITDIFINPIPRERTKQPED